HGAPLHPDHDGRSARRPHPAAVLLAAAAAVRDAPDRRLEASDAPRARRDRRSGMSADGGSLRSVFERQPDRRYIMFGGKGGLGKTTLSATTAFWLARQGKRVLLFSVDPQASLSDIFQQDIFGKGAVPIMENLWAQEVDADQRIKDYQEEIRKKIL